MKKKTSFIKNVKYRDVVCMVATCAFTLCVNQNTLASTVPDTDPQAATKYILMIEEQSKKFGEFAEETTDTRLNYINFLKNRGEYTEAEKLCRPIITAYEKSGRADAEVLARIEDQLGRVLRHQGNYAEAELYQRKTLAIYEKRPKYFALVISSALINLAKVLMEQPDKLQEAKQMLLRALDIETKLAEKGHLSEASGVLGICLINTGETNEARKYLLPLLISEKNSGLPRDSYASLINLIGTSYFKDKQYDQAIKYHQQALDYLRELQPQHPKLANFLTSIASVNLIQGQYELAAKNLRQAQELTKSFAVDRFENLTENQRTKFIALYNSPAIRKNNAAFALDVDLECSTLQELKQNSKANKVEALDRIYQKRRINLGTTSPLTCEALLQLAVLLQNLGGDVQPLVATAGTPVTEFAKDLLRDDKNSTAEIKRNIKALGGRNSALKFVTEELMLLVYFDAHHGEYELANENLLLAERCLNAQYSSANNSNRDAINTSNLYADKLLQIASAWLALGKYNEATKLTEKALAAVLEQKEDSELKLEALLQLGNLSLAESDIESATQYAREAERITTKLFSSESVESIPSYKLWAQIKFAVGQYDEVTAITNRALRCHKIEKADMAFFYNICGFAFLCTGNYKQAETKLIQARKECIDLGDQLEDRALASSTATALAEVYINLGERRKAFHLLDRALQLDNANRTTEALLASARDCAGLARLEELEGDHELATRYALRAAGYTDKFLKSGFSQLSFAQQCSFINVTRQVRSTLLNTCNDSKNLQEAYGYIIQWEGLLLETLRSQSAISTRLANASKETKKVVAELSAVRTRIGELANGDQSTFAEMSALTTKKERLERQLSEETGSQGIADVMAKRDVEGFRKLLKPDQAFLDIMTFSSVKDNSEHYALIAMKGGAQREAKMFDLGATTPIDKQITEWRNSITQKLPPTSRDTVAGTQDVTSGQQDVASGQHDLASEQRDAASAQRDLHLDRSVNRSTLSSDEYLKLSKSLASLFINNAELSTFLGKDIRKVYLCPQAAMAKMPWNSLSTICGTDNFTICEIDSPREYVQITLAKEKAERINDKLLLAGVSVFNNDAFNDLPGTKKEIKGIQVEADKAAFAYEILLDDQATKAIVRDEISAATIAHFSTHGFARGDKAANSEDEIAPKVQFAVLTNVGSIGRNPLVDSGLVLSSSGLTKENTKLVANGDSQSGTTEPIQLSKKFESAVAFRAIQDDRKKTFTNLLTAEELISLNLKNCKLVSLSACKTGLGTGLKGQGVIGLRSAILAAGGRSILMSLWSVDDDATEQLMQKFYSYLLDPKNPMTEIDALQKAQDYVRSQQQWQSPIFWAGWVIAGDGWQTVR
ncbi:MAG: CHAT domain-containing protein [Cyanobacteria bacterium SZAS-4]|nr:CHAT domain-containing protein [Cyanobacteria bacterium SZAS-4]